MDGWGQKAGDDTESPPEEGAAFEAGEPEVEAPAPDADAEPPAPEPEGEPLVPEPEVETPAPEVEPESPVPEPDIEPPVPEPDIEPPAPEPEPPAPEPEPEPPALEPEPEPPAPEPEPELPAPEPEPEPPAPEPEPPAPETPQEESKPASSWGSLMDGWGESKKEEAPAEEPETAPVPEAASDITSLTRSHTRRLSSSPRPGRGETVGYSRYARARHSPSSEKAAALQPVVPRSTPSRLIRERSSSRGSARRPPLPTRRRAPR